MDAPAPTSLIGLLWRAGRFGWQRRRLIHCAWSGITHRNERIRVSCAQLIRVHYGNKYLLVPSARIPSQMQPPGGVTKVFSAGRTFLEEIGAHAGDDYKFAEKDSDDLRVHVPGGKLIKFLGWYSAANGRERSPEREFKEELTDTGILPAELFASPKLQRYRVKLVGPRYTPHFKCTEVLVHEFFGLDSLTEEQAASLRELQASENCAPAVGSDAKFGWFTSQEIDSHGRLPDAEQQHWRVAEHAQWMT